MEGTSGNLALRTSHLRGAKAMPATATSNAPTSDIQRRSRSSDDEQNVDSLNRRTDKLEALKAAVAAGTFEVDSRHVAKLIVDDAEL